MIKNEPAYCINDLEEVVGKLRSYELNIKKKETRYDQVQVPRMYNGISSSSTRNASSDTSLVGSIASKRQQGGDNGGNNKFMPLSLKAAKEHLALLVSFVASYENYIQGKIFDPTTFDEDYDKIDPNNLEEMDLQWQMAMISKLRDSWIAHEENLWERMLVLISPK
ncbi:hypothetical protein Hanom_Chr13g01187061 [Helianthus anomalus]